MATAYRLYRKTSTPRRSHLLRILTADGFAKPLLDTDVLRFTFADVDFVTGCLAINSATPGADFGRSSNVTAATLDITQDVLMSACAATSGFPGNVTGTTYNGVGCTSTSQNIDTLLLVIGMLTPPFTMRMQGVRNAPPHNGRIPVFFHAEFEPFDLEDGMVIPNTLAGSGDMLFDGDQFYDAGMNGECAVSLVCP